MFEIYPPHLHEPDIVGAIHLSGPKRCAEGCSIPIWVRANKPIKPYCYAIPDRVRVDEAYVRVQVYQTNSEGQQHLISERRLECDSEWRRLEIEVLPPGTRTCEVVATLFYDELPYWTRRKQIQIGHDIKERQWVLKPTEERTLANETLSIAAPFSGLLYAIVRTSGGGIFSSKGADGQREHRLTTKHIGVQERCLGFAEKGGSIAVQAGNSAISIVAMYWQALSPQEVERYDSSVIFQSDRCLVINNDGLSEGFIKPDWKASQIKEQILRYQNTGVSALHWCTLVSDVACYRSSVVDFLGEGVEQYPAERLRIAQKNYSEIEECTNGLFPHLNELGKSIALPIWASLRMNAFYGFHPFGHCMNGRFWFDHPELRIQWTKEAITNPETPLSFAYKEVWQRRINLLVEVSHFGCEGVHLDFCRYPWTMGYDLPLLEEFQKRHGICGKELPLDDPRWIAIRQARMTEVMRNLRLALKEAGESRGRQIPIAVRLPAARWESFGFDPAAWVKEELVDILIPAFPGHDRWFDIEPWVAMAASTPVQVLGGIEYYRFETAPTELTDDEVERGKRAGMRGPHHRDSLLSRVAYFYEKGAAGVYLFNAWEEVGLMENLEQAQFVDRWKLYEAPEHLLSMPEGQDFELSEADLSAI